VIIVHPKILKDIVRDCGVDWEMFRDLI